MWRVRMYFDILEHELKNGSVNEFGLFWCENKKKKEWEKGYL